MGEIPNDRDSDSALVEKSKTFLAKQGRTNTLETEIEQIHKYVLNPAFFCNPILKLESKLSIFNTFQLTSKHLWSIEGQMVALKCAFQCNVWRKKIFPKMCLRVRQET